ncbi:MAG: hypothetical protein ABWJ42_04100 [Sulfolobales archaeon]
MHTLLDRDPLDHDLFIDKELRFYVVFGSIHPPGRIYSYLKYEPCYNSRECLSSIWRYNSVPLKRLVERYSVEYVRRVFERNQSHSHEISYGVAVPYVSWEHVIRYFKPEERLREIYSNPRDSLELKLSELVESIKSSLGVSLSDIGVSGSMLGGFHNPTYSDIDLVIYKCENISRIVENIETLVKPLDREELNRWISNQMFLHNIDLDLARRMYRVYRRGVFRNTQVTFIFPQEACPYPCRYVSKPIRCIEMKTYIEPRQCKALQYPGEIEISASISNQIKVKKIYLYEGAYSPILYEGGEILVRGSLQKVYDLRGCEEYYVISVGSRECPSEIKPLR